MPEAGGEGRGPGLHPRLREREVVTPLELFFDLVFVLALTQCTALMAHHPSWEAVAQGMLVLGMLWWAWVGYSWLTSVIDPEEGAVRFAFFGAMAAMLVAALAVPEAFGDLGLVFALAYGAVRSGHIALFILASPDDPGLRRGVIRLGATTAASVALLAAASQVDGLVQGGLWALALFLDIYGTYRINPEGWRLVPEHFAERHGLIVIIALGESIVAIGVGASGALTFGVGAAAVLGVALSAALWWVYFDVVAIVAARRLASAEPGLVRNAMARDSYSMLHFVMVAGIVLAALGLEQTLAHHDEHLEAVPAFALLGGPAFYLLGHAAFRYRHVHTIAWRRLITAAILFASVPLAERVPALAALAWAIVVVWAMIGFDVRAYGEARRTLRSEA